MNAHKRLHGLILDESSLDWNSSAGFRADGRADNIMNDSTPRRGRRPASRRPACRLPISSATGRRKEERYMNPQLTDVEPLRHDLISRVRQEIEDGVYDTPERFEQALDRLADRLEAD